jgi:hypothetical protein
VVGAVGAGGFGGQARRQAVVLGEIAWCGLADPEFALESVGGLLGDVFVERARLSAKGDCWDNAVAESTIGTVKAEALGDHVPADIHELRRILFPYIEGFYNQHRLHSTLDYQSPAEYERNLANSTHAA